MQLRATVLSFVFVLISACSTYHIDTTYQENVISQREQERRKEEERQNARIETYKREEQIRFASYENKLRMRFCAQKQLLYTTLVQPRGAEIEANCIYQLAGHPLSVLQSINQGILVTFNQHAGPEVANIVFYIKTKQTYVDNSSIQNMLVKSIGIFKYKTLFGQEKITYAFQFLDNDSQINLSN